MAATFPLEVKQGNRLSQVCYDLLSLLTSLPTERLDASPRVRGANASPLPAPCLQQHDSPHCGIPGEKAVPSSPPSPDPSPVLELLEAFRRSKILFAAVSLG